MSFIYEPDRGTKYEAGYFLAEDEPATRETRTILQAGATTAANGSKYVKAGTPFPANGATAIGFVYEDVDVTGGDMAGSVVTKGVIYEDRLPVKLDSAAKTALQGLGFKFIAASPTVTRPY